MKVCTVSTSFPRYKNDYSGSFVFDLAKAMVEQGAEIDVITLYYPGSKKFEIMNGIRVHRFQYWSPSRYQKLATESGIATDLKSNIIARIQLPFLLLFFLLKTHKISKSCDIIHAHFTLSGLAAVFSQRIGRKRIILTCHGSDINYIPESGMVRTISIHTLEKVNKIITVSYALKNKIVDLGISQDKIVIIPNSVDTKRFSPRRTKSNGFEILWAGRMVREKGLEYLFQAMIEVIDKIPDVKLILIGDGEQRKYLEKLAVKIGIRDNLHFVGIKEHSAMPDYMAQAKLFVLPSLSEGMPLTLLEAMSSGIPIVATKVGGIPEVVKNGENGILVPPGDSKELSKAILRLMENKTLSDELGKNARKLIIDKYSLDSAARKTMKVYTNLKT
ncbi:MAG: glycosyltransferase family 4 protein [Methanomassiliicoccales archaeon]|nr:MAG: glycosyltransferase family 4 protein [Methanomassiliicoccales archaeon]